MVLEKSSPSDETRQTCGRAKPWINKTFEPPTGSILNCIDLGKESLCLHQNFLKHDKAQKYIASRQPLSTKPKKPTETLLSSRLCIIRTRTAQCYLLSFGCNAFILVSLQVWSVEAVSLGWWAVREQSILSAASSALGRSQLTPDRMSRAKSWPIPVKWENSNRVSTLCCSVGSWPSPKTKCKQNSS